jgi:hypothetical protein
MTSASTSPSADWQFLLACAKLEPTSADCRYIKQHLGKRDADWTQIASLARHNDLGPLVYRSMQRIQQPLGPAALAAFKTFESACCANAMRNAILYRELKTVLEALQKREKAVIVLKGAALAEMVYVNRAFRPMSDVDLLVRKRDLTEVEEVLSALGYVLDRQQQQMKAWYLTHHYHLVFRKSTTGLFNFSCEIHWLLERPNPAFEIDIEGIWERAIPATIAEADVLALSPEDNLLHLCLHTCKHKLIGGFRAFCDISETIRRFGPQMDWEQVHTRAGNWRVSTLVFVPLHLVKELLGAEVPDRVLNALAAPPGGMDVLATARATIFEDPVSRTLFPDFFQLLRGRRFADRAEALKRVMAPAVIAQRFGLPPSSKKVYFYYPLRVLHLARYMPDLWRFVRNGRQVSAQAKDKRRLADWLSPLTQQKNDTMKEHTDPSKD